MNSQTDPLSDLRDIHLPDPVSWWPPAPGWWMVLGLAIVLLVLAVWGYRRLRTPAAYQSARHELQGLREAYAANRQDPKLVTGLSMLLRRYAMALYGRERVAGLTGKQWLTFLNKMGNTDIFTGDVGNVLVSVPYGSQVPAQGEALLTAVEQWLKGNRRPRS